MAGGFFQGDVMTSLVTRPAPDFTAPAVLGDDTIDETFTLSSLRGRYVVLFFYPLAFTFVCPTEILAFDEALDDFRARDAEIVGVSVDSHYSHLAWKRTPVDDGGIGPVRFPLVSDLKKSIARSYEVLYDDEMALRGLFLIDRDGVVRHAVINDIPLGRNVSEALRMVDALRFYDEKGEVCPANWQKGGAGMEETHDGVVDYLSRFSK
jgi:peroxiredoxin (alkyl hydroperoxide reductase subunit C)